MIPAPLSSLATHRADDGAWSSEKLRPSQPAALVGPERFGVTAPSRRSNVISEEERVDQKAVRASPVATEIRVVDEEHDTALPELVGDH